MRALTFAHKIVLLAAIAGGALLLILARVLLRGRDDAARLRLVEKAHFPALMLSRDLKETLAQVQRGLQDAASSKDAALLEETDGLHRLFLDRLKEKRTALAGNANEIADIERQFLDYYEVARRTTGRMIAGELGEELVAALKTMGARYNAVRELIEKFADRQQVGMGQAFAAVARDQRRSTILVLAIIVLAMTSLAAVSFVMTRSLTRSLAEAVRVSDQVAGGDLTVRIEGETADETGRVLSAMRRMVGSLQGVVLRVKGSSEQVGRASREMSASGAQITRGATEQVASSEKMSSIIAEMARTLRSIAEGTREMSQQTGQTFRDLGASIQKVAADASILSTSVEQTALAIEEMRASIRSLAELAESQDRNTGRTSAAVESILGAIEEAGEEVGKAETISARMLRDGAAGGDAVAKTAASMHRMAEVVRTTVEAIRGFAERSAQIREIVRLIEEISDRTNLLALNASIVAAQSGEHGRGFAVIAGQIRELSNHTAPATREIGTLIDGVLVENNRILELGVNALRETEAGERLSQTAGAAITNMRSSIAESSALMTRINALGLRQKDLTSEVVSSIAELRLIAGQLR